MNAEYKIREITVADVPQLYELYRQVAIAGGLGRTAAEVSLAYIEDFVSKSLARGLILALSPVGREHQLVGEIHGYALGLQTFAHVLEQVTMVVHPVYQGFGLGKQLLNALQNEIQVKMSQIRKVELMCFSNNQRALNLYLHNGFGIEGRRQNRVLLPDGTFADGIALAWFNPAYRVE